VGWLASASAMDRSGVVFSAGLLVACPDMMWRGAAWRGPDGEDADLVDVVVDGVVGAGDGVRRVLIRRLAARARISFMRSMSYAPFPSVSHRRRIARM
jgi:hypothetical protein